MGAEDDPYAHVAKGKLKLKQDGSIKKKKKSKSKKVLEQVIKTTENQETPTAKTQLTRTKAELAFKQMQEKMVHICQNCSLPL